VQKHGGKRTAWINGVPQQAGSSDEKAPESMPVTVPGRTKPIKIKVGQRGSIGSSAGSKTPEPIPTKPVTTKQDVSDDD